MSKRKDSAYRSGRSSDWLKMKNSNAPAAKREAEEDRHRLCARCDSFCVVGGVAMTGKNRIMIFGPKNDGTSTVYTPGSGPPPYGVPGQTYARQSEGATYLRHNLRVSRSALDYARITRSFFAISSERDGVIL